MPGASPLEALEPLKRPTIAETVFEELHKQILSLELPPGTKMSEMDVAKALGVSRQPVRDAFFRLSQLGFLEIRPQRATIITKISEASVFRAKFIRIALEVACLRAAIEVITPVQLDRLEGMLKEQQAAINAGNRMLFHALDDNFHHEICRIAGHEYTWALIREQKAHMDRLRYLSLEVGAQSAFDGHRKIVDAMHRRDIAGAEEWLRDHLGRINQILTEIRGKSAEYFEE